MWSLFVYLLGVTFCFGMFIMMMKVGKEKVTLAGLILVILGSLLPFFNIILGIIALVITIISLADFEFFNKIMFDFRDERDRW